MHRIALLALALSFACQSRTPADEESPPVSSLVAPSPARPERVLLITVDTLRADVLGSYGGPADTPEIDRWAASGVRFDRAFSASMLTNPSHASILTSLYPRDHGVYDNQSGISDGSRTLAGELGRAGYRTGAVVAFPHLNPNVANLAQGFDRFIPATRSERRAAEQVSFALAEIDALGTDRFFYWLHLSDPHAPYAPEGEVRATSETRTPLRRAARVSPGFQRNNPWFESAFKRFEHTEELYDRYVAEVEAVDRALVRLRQALEARDLWEQTLVVLTSDHGENFGEHDMWFHHGGLYDASVRVPLLIRGPGLRPRVERLPVEHVDIAPTVLELLDLPRWQPMRGRDLVVPAAEQERHYAFSEHMMAQAVAVRDGEWLAILHRKSTRQFPSYPFEAGRRELWRRNPGGEHLELEPKDYPEEMRRLGAAIEDYLGAGRTLHARRAVGQDRESLRALGYIE